MNTFPRMAEIVKPAKLGCAEITHYTVTKLDVLREVMHGAPAEEGAVAILRVSGRIMMSDTRHEKITNYDVVRHARGHVMLAGLGLGMIAHPILAKPEVASSGKARSGVGYDHRERKRRDGTHCPYASCIRQTTCDRGRHFHLEAGCRDTLRLHLF